MKRLTLLITIAVLSLVMVASAQASPRIPAKAAAILAHIHPVPAVPVAHPHRACGGWTFCVNAYHPVNYGGGVFHYDSTLEAWPGFIFQMQANFQIKVGGVWYTASGSWSTNGWWKMYSNLFNDGAPGVGGVPPGYSVRNQTSVQQYVSSGDYPTATDTSQIITS